MPNIAIKTKSQIDSTIEQYRNDIKCKPMHYVSYETKKADLIDKNRFSSGKTMPDKIRSNYTYDEVMKTKVDNKR